LAVEVTRHHPFTEQLEATHFGFDEATSMIASPLLPYCPAKPARGVQDGVAGRGAGTSILPRLGIFARRDDCLCTSLRTSRRNGLMTALRVVGAVATDARDDFVIGDLVERHGSIGASPVALSVTSMARISSVAASMPK
jgi:hypothetical protein